MDMGIHMGPRTNPPWIPSDNLTSGPIFTNWKKFKEDFHFMKKGDKKIQCWFSSKLLWRQGTPNSESGPTKPLPRNHTQHLSTQPPELWTEPASICAVSQRILCIC